MEDRNHHSLVIAVSPILIETLKLFSVFGSKSVYDPWEQRTTSRIRVHNQSEANLARA